MVPPVGHVDVSVFIDAHASRPVELPFTPARAPVGRDELSVRRELLHAVVAPIGDEDMAILTGKRSPTAG